MAGPVRIGIDDIKNGYDMYSACPYYALFELANAGRGLFAAGRMVFPYKGDDRDGEGWRILKENLTVLDNTAPSTQMMLQFYEELGRKDIIDSKTPHSGSFLLQMKPKDSFAPAINGLTAQSPADMSFLNYLQTELRLEKEANQDLRQEVQELEEELEEYRHKPAGEEVGGIIGQIGALGTQHSWIADIIKDWSTVFKHTFTGASGRTQQAPHISGIDNTGPPDKRVNNAIEVLVQWYGNEYGQGTTDQEKMQTGFSKFADDMQLLASLTSDADMMHLALKKLRAAAA